MSAIFSLLDISPDEGWELTFGKQFCATLTGVVAVFLCCSLCIYIYTALFTGKNELLKLKQSTGYSQVISFNHNWTIENAAALFEDHIGDRHPVISSQRFGPNDQVQFSLQIYPRGISPDYEDQVSLYLNLETVDKEEYEVLFDFSVVQANGKKVNIHGNNSVSKFCQDNPSWGLNNYIHRETLQNLTNGYLPNNTLTINCEILMMSTSERACSEGRSEPTMPFADWLENEKFADLVLVVGGEELPAHKAILANRSPVFADMIRSETLQTRIDIAEIEVELFRQLLAYIYTGKVSQMGQFVSELLPLADKFKVNSLKSACEQYLASRLSSKTVLDQIRFAERHNAEHLRSQALNFMRKQISGYIQVSQDTNQLVEVFEDLLYKE